MHAHALSELGIMLGHPQQLIVSLQAVAFAQVVVERGLRRVAAGEQ